MIKRSHGILSLSIIIGIALSALASPCALSTPQHGESPASGLLDPASTATMEAWHGQEPVAIYCLSFNAAYQDAVPQERLYEYLKYILANERSIIVNREIGNLPSNPWTIAKLMKDDVDKLPENSPSFQVRILDTEDFIIPLSKILNHSKPDILNEAKLHRNATSTAPYDARDIRVVVSTLDNKQFLFVDANGGVSNGTYSWKLTKVDFRALKSLLGKYFCKRKR